MANISVNDFPGEDVYDSDNEEIYVVNVGPSGGSASGYVSVINGSNNSVVASIPVGVNPAGIAFDAATGDVFVTDHGSYPDYYGNVTVIDGSTNAVVATIPVGLGPNDIAFDPVNQRLYVADSVSNSVAVIDGSTDNVIASIAASLFPVGVAVDSRNDVVYVTDYQSSNLTVINATTDTVVGSIQTVDHGNDLTPWTIVFDPTNGNLYVGNYAGGGVTAINGTSGRVISYDCSTANCPGISDIAYDAVDNELYATRGQGTAVGGPDVVYVVDPSRNSILGAITVGGSSPDGVAIDSANDHVFVAAVDYGTVTVLNGSVLWIGMLTLTPNPTPLGDTALVNVTTWGVTSGLTFTYTGLPAGCASSNAPSLDCRSSQIGNFSVTVFVNASSGVSDHLSAVLAVVSDLSILAFAPTLSPVYLNEAYSMNLRVAGGALPYTVQYYTPSAAGCTVMYGLGFTYLQCIDRDQPGAFLFRATVNDSAGESVSQSVNVTISDEPLTLAISAQPSPADASNPVNFSVSYQGGTLPATFSWLFGDGAGSSLQNPTHTYAQVGTYTAIVWVNDSVGESRSSNLTIVIGPPPVVTLAVSTSSPLLGQSVAFVAHATGGAPPYSYDYLGFPPGCVSVDNTSVGCLPTQSGTYNVSVVATDQNKGRAIASVIVRVVFNFTIIAPAQDVVGHTLTIELQTDGGYGNLDYNYSGLPPGCTNRNTNDLSCTPTGVGTYDVIVTVRDQVGNSAIRDVDVEVVAPSPYANLSTDLGGPLGISVILAIAVATIASLALYRYRRPGYRSLRSEMDGSDPYHEYRLPHPIGQSQPGKVSELESEDDPFRGVT